MAQRRIIALLAALFALAIVPLGCGGDEVDGGSGSSDVETETETEASNALGSAGLKEPKSGRVDLTVEVSSGGREGGSVEANLSGPFRLTGGVLPVADLTATVEGSVEGKPVDFEGGLTLLPKRGAFTYEGVEYDIPPFYFNNAKLSFLPSKPKQGGKGQTFALDVCREAAIDRAAADFGDDLVEEGQVRVGGVPTTQYGGEVDVPAALGAAVDLAGQSPCRAQLASAGVELEEVEAAEDDVAAAVQNAHLEVNVGNDGIVRRVSGELAADPKGGGFDAVEVAFELNLSGVNEPQKVAPPSPGGKLILAWFETFGMSSLEAVAVSTETDGLGRVLEMIASGILPESGGAGGGS